MKTSSLHLLLGLYSREKEEVIELPLSAAKNILHNLSDSGQRSLLYHLQRQGLVLSKSIGEKKRLVITSHGRELLEGTFPALKPPDRVDHWYVLVFVKSPSQDPQFRYLRSLVMKSGALAITKGVFIFPNFLPTAVKTECQTRYMLSVIIWRVHNWELGDEMSIVIKGFKLQDVTQIYSGISNELASLTTKIENNIELKNQYKNDIFMAFDRFVKMLTSDFGLTSVYFPQEIAALEILSEFQKLFIL